MKNVNLSINNIRTLNNLVGNNKNDEAVAMLRSLTGCNAFIVKYRTAFAGKYAPKGYGDTAILWANGNEEEEKIFSYFLSNLAYAEVFGW